MKNENWTAENIPNQKGKVAIVTGSSSGIGFEAARVLAEKEATVIVAVRNAEKGKAVVEKILQQNKNANVELMILDLADLKSVEKFAEEFKKNYSRLDLLINNAGIMIPPYSKTKDGFEMQFGTNHLGHFALTGLLLEVLLTTKGARIVNVSSGAHKVGNINFDDVNWEKRKYSAWRAYGDSKIANLYFTTELVKKLKEANADVRVTSAHPGYTATDLQRHSGLINFINNFNFLAMEVWQGTLPTLRAAFDEKAESGDYFGPKGFMEMRGFPGKVEPNKLSQDSKIAEKLWKVSEDLTKVKFNFGHKLKAVGKT